MEIHLTKADGERTGEMILDLTIHIDQREVPDIDQESHPYPGLREFYIGEARRLADALQNHLPGGTFDQLLAELCRRKASLFRVPYGDAGTTEESKT